MQMPNSVSHLPDTARRHRMFRLTASTVARHQHSEQVFLCPESGNRPRALGPRDPGDPSRGRRRARRLIADPPYYGSERAPMRGHTVRLAPGGETRSTASWTLLPEFYAERTGALL